MKKILRCITALLCIAGLSVSPDTVSQMNAADSSTETVYSLVLFAQFPDRKDNFMSGRTETMLSAFEKENTCRSLSGYINTISYGQMNTGFVYPQLNDGTVTPYVMKNTIDKYDNTDLMTAELISAVSVPENAKLDGNHDGTVDNIIVIFDADEKTGGSVLWSKAFSLPGITVNGCRTGMVNLVNSWSLFDNTITGGAGVLCHEFLHSLGYPDLYRANGVSGIPVGQWDIMAADSIYVQYPLAWQRYSISGWLGAETVTESGKYTLSPASSEAGNRLYILKTPLSDTEFFAVEYRQKGQRYSDEMDTKIYGTGLVVYRINTSYSGNRKENGDEIYVFRPDETGTADAAGDIFSSFYGGEGAPDSIGSLSPKADIQDGAIVYSDGTNSGIRISDISMNKDSLTFSIEFADMSDANVWQQIPSEDWMNFRSTLDMTIYDGKPYIITDSDNGAVISEYADGKWIKTTSAVPSAESAKFCISDGIPYMLYNDSSYTYVLAEFRNGKWNEILRGTEISQYQDIDVFGDSLWIAYTTGSWPYALHLKEYSISGGKVINEYDGCTDVCNISVTASENGAAVSYRHAAADSRPGADFAGNGKTESKELSFYSSGSTSSALVNGNYVFTCTDEAAQVITFRNDGGSFLNIADYLPGTCFSSVPFEAGDKTGLIINTQDSTDLSVYTFRESDRVFHPEKCGNSLASEIVNNPCAVSDGTFIYAAYAGSDGRIITKKNRISEAEKIRGDINGDHRVNSDDYLTLLIYFITGEVIINDADLDENGTVNIADVCLLRNIILNGSEK